MRCPHCESADMTERRERTALGYQRFRCITCKREFNDRTGTSFNHLQYHGRGMPRGALAHTRQIEFARSARDVPGAMALSQS